jgi:hypothetical protein
LLENAETDGRGVADGEASGHALTASALPVSSSPVDSTNTQSTVRPHCSKKRRRAPVVRMRQAPCRRASRQVLRLARGAAICWALGTTPTLIESAVTPVTGLSTVVLGCGNDTGPGLGDEQHRAGGTLSGLHFGCSTAFVPMPAPGGGFRALFSISSGRSRCCGDCSQRHRRGANRRPQPSFISLPPHSLVWHGGRAHSAR